MVDEMPSDEEFDAWDDEMLEDAVREASTSFEVKWLVKGTSFFCRMPSGKCYCLPLGITMRQFEELSAVDDVEAINAFRSLMEAFAPGRSNDLANEPIQSVMSMMDAFGQAVSMVQGAPLGE